MAAESTKVRLPVVSGLGQTLRKDNWWVSPLLTFLGLATFITYATFRGLEGAHYSWGPYLSPFASPYLETRGLGLPLVTPAMLILPFPAIFRFTCYYHRKTYYRAFAMTPPACAVGAANPGAYNGERKILLFQNLHRFALYIALVFVAFLWHDVVKAMSWDGHFGLGVGSLVILADVSLVTLYTFSCHSFRHLVGGVIDSYSTSRFGLFRHRVWRAISAINVNHGYFAWASLCAVGLADVYVRAVATGAITDFRIL